MPVREVVRGCVSAAPHRARARLRRTSLLLGALVRGIAGMQTSRASFGLASVANRFVEPVLSRSGDVETTRGNRRRFSASRYGILSREGPAMTFAVVDEGRRPPSTACGGRFSS